jgi:hypothetical protein
MKLLHKDPHYQENHDKWIKEHPEKSKKYAKIHRKHNITNQEWKQCKKYFSNQCAYCGLQLSEHYVNYNGQMKLFDFDKEHVYHTGENDLSNCVPSCRICNVNKYQFNVEEWYKEQSYYSEERLNKINTWINNDYKIYTK